MKFPRGFVVFFSIAIIGMLASNSSPVHAGRSFASYLFSPFLKTGYIVSNKGEGFVKTIKQLSTLLKRVNELEATNSELQAKLIKYDELKTENSLLRQELSAKSGSGRELLSAEVVGRVPNKFQNVIHINRGSDDGIKAGQGVIAQGFLVGVIKKVNPKTSTVVLITDHSFLVTAILQDSRTIGLVRGGLSGIIMEQIPVNQQIKEREPIISSGLANEVPSQIPIGYAGEKISSEADIFQTVKVNSPIDFNRLEFVFVIISP